MQKRKLENIGSITSQHCFTHTTKKMGLSQHLQNRQDSPRKHWNRVKMPISVFFPGASNCHAVTVSIGLPNLYQCFSKASGQVQALFRPCSSVFTCVGQLLPIALKTCTSDFRAYIDTFFFFFLIIKKRWYRSIYTVF